MSYTQRECRDRAIQTTLHLYEVGGYETAHLDDDEAAAIILRNVRHWLQRYGYSRAKASRTALRLCRMHDIGRFHDRSPRGWGWVTT